jgi:flagellar biosynthetic protein FliQ
MSNTDAVDLVSNMLMVMLKIAAPMLLLGMVIGLIISLFQSVTSIQDQTLTFVPKIAAMVLLAAFLAPWLMLKLGEFAVEMFRLF